MLGRRTTLGRELASPPRRCRLRRLERGICGGAIAVGAIAVALLVAPRAFAQQADGNAKKTKTDEKASPTSSDEKPSGTESSDSSSPAEEPEEKPAEPAEKPGASPADPGGGPPAESVPPGFATDRSGDPLVALHFRGNSPHLRFFLGPAPQDNHVYGTTPASIRDTTQELLELCEAPCARWVYPGRYSVGIAPRGGRLVRAHETLWLADPSVVTGEYHSYGWVRAVGWATMALGIAAGSALVLYAFDHCAGDGLCLQNTPSAWFGAGAFFAGVTGGLLLTLKDDEVSFDVAPARRLPDPN